MGSASQALDEVARTGSFGLMREFQSKARVEGVVTGVQEANDIVRGTHKNPCVCPVISMQ